VTKLFTSLTPFSLRLSGDAGSFEAGGGGGVGGHCGSQARVRWCRDRSAPRLGGAHERGVRGEGKSGGGGGFLVSDSDMT
jgi:hypothetical protein